MDNFRREREWPLGCDSGQGARDEGRGLVGETFRVCRVLGCAACCGWVGCGVHVRARAAAFYVEAGGDDAGAEFADAYTD